MPSKDELTPSCYSCERSVAASGYGDECGRRNLAVLSPGVEQKKFKEA